MRAQAKFMYKGEWFTRIQMDNDTGIILRLHDRNVIRLVNHVRNSAVPLLHPAARYKLSDAVKWAERHKALLNTDARILHTARLHCRYATSLDDFLPVEKVLADSIIHIRNIDNGSPMYTTWDDTHGIYQATTSTIVKENFHSRDKYEVHFFGIGRLADWAFRIAESGEYKGVKLSESTIDFMFKWAECIDNHVHYREEYRPLQVNTDMMLLKKC